MSLNITRFGLCRFNSIKGILRRSSSTRMACACHRWNSHINQRRPYSSEAIASPEVEGIDKEYSPKIKSLVDEISRLTLLEVADLNELIKKTLNITDTPMMAMGAMAAPLQQEEEETEAKQEKSSFTVRLLKFDESRKVAIIKEIKSLMEGFNLVQAKKFVESVPTTVKADIAKDEAEKLQKALEAVGGSIEIE